MPIEEPQDINTSETDLQEREEKLRLRNDMQIELAKRMCGDVEDKTKILEWLEAHSERFRKLVNGHEEDIIEMYKTNPERALALAEAELTDKERTGE